MAAKPVVGIEVLGTAQQAAWQRRTLPPVERLPAGIWSVPVPIPDNPLRYTLSYLVPGDDGVVVVDPGWDTEQGWDALTSGLGEAGLDTGDVTGIVATHVHPDHHGLSARLRAASGAWVAMHPAERDALRQRPAAGDGGEAAARVRDWLSRAGAPDEDIASLTRLVAGTDGQRPAGPMAEPDLLLDDGDRVPLAGRQLRVVWTPGHTPGHLCLRETNARLLLTGDHVLPRITPNIGLIPGSTGSPLGQFLDSLERVGGFDDHDALPAHEYRFRGLAGRTRALREHHEQRCAEILVLVGEFGEPTVWQVAEHLTWSRPWAEIGNMRFGAVAETAAHLEHLARAGRLAWVPAGTEAGLVRVRPTGTGSRHPAQEH
ncbi:MBL fold metallo-hydrolase [Amycolatopsis acidiphila]|uniref:MBL fold metallo-hydrolase n=1 Tax=Amycolatopsis acidiphila TaxID=715473 RepID=A0A557ZSF1_9PSEU|nr:MBL fold metallo-hydrolase [Amycolatopsis acidiphila]TVT14931.1 MBL fold metallo-hydrolase [Amycolatopsis acidiphila]UIJ63088.1 MBL fold metallo-hydrolase [Amycolatopsis acidiphila]GHG66057.1 MBL fold metallo-hydrolase [Amycolatopsis acidiphila]